MQSKAYGYYLGLRGGYQWTERGMSRSVTRTAVAVVPNLGHAMVRCEYKSGIRIFEEIQDECLRFAHNVVDSLDVVHVLLGVPYEFMVR